MRDGPMRPTSASKAECADLRRRRKVRPMQLVDEGVAAHGDEGCVKRHEMGGSAGRLTSITAEARPASGRGGVNETDLRAQRLRRNVVYPFVIPAICVMVVVAFVLAQDQVPPTAPLVLIAALVLGPAVWLDRQTGTDTLLVNPWSIIGAPAAVLFGPIGVAVLYGTVAAGSGLPSPRRYRAAVSNFLNLVFAVAAAPAAQEVASTVGDWLGVVAAVVVFIVIADVLSFAAVTAVAWADGFRFFSGHRLLAILTGGVVAALVTPTAVAAYAAGLVPAMTGLAFILVVVMHFYISENRRAVELRREETLRKQQERLLELVVHEGDRQRRAFLEEIHDGPLQLITAARSLTALGIEEVDAGSGTEDLHIALGALDEAIEGLRAQLRSDQTPFRGELYLSAALRRLGELPPMASPSLSFTVDVEAEADGTEVVHAVLFSLLREAATNAAKHARASGIAVSVRAEQGWIVATVTDDGLGFDVQAAMAQRQSGHVGLPLMHSRARAAGGSVEIVSDAGRGASVTFRLPGTGSAGQ